ncbi:MAG: hypothetical protein LJE62_00725 [Silicimonas sp.]|nr:hypothetical protein [Silicimonas sp.]
MKPITDDVVFSIMKGLEKRERNKTALYVARKTLPEKILGSIGNRRVISLDVARRRANRTVSGMFCYVARD